MAISSPPAPAQGAELLKAILGPVAPHMQALDKCFAEQVSQFEPEVRPYAEYCLRHSGKRIRPMLLFYSAWQGGRVVDSHIRAAAVVEMVHLATLVHDDILDQADMRHKATTLSHKHGNDVAVLVGDALFAHALALASQFPTTEVCRAVAIATQRVCAGEIAQTFSKRNASLTTEAYYRIIDLKTAELFSVACQLGGWLSAPDGGYSNACATFGRKLGIAYQIYDDLNDLIGAEETTGKTLGTDAINSKLTLPMLLLLDKLDATAKIAFIADFKTGSLSLEKLRALLLENGIPKLVADSFNQEIAAAECALAPYSALESTSHLLNLSTYVKGLFKQV